MQFGREIGEWRRVEGGVGNWPAEDIENG